MRPGRWVVCAAGAVALGMGQPSYAEGAASAGFTSDLLSEYVWRGQRLNKEPVFQPGVTAAYHAAKMIGSELVARGVRHAVVTLGRRGCVLVDRNGAEHIPT
ncbi:MAG: hypothetical protein KBE04_00175, partial [Phycisphaerae bacterium]|nr:hypothetical protein [Phycisphaerae bacterium]